MPALKIYSKREGFRRCGMAHPVGPVIHPDGTFTPEQVERLKKEPMLIVMEVEEAKPAEKSEGDSKKPKGGPKKPKEDPKKTEGDPEKPEDDSKNSAEDGDK